MATFQFHFVLLSAYVIEMNFARICALQWTKVKWSLERVFYHFPIFGLKNAKSNKYLKKIRVLSSFFRIEVKVISNPSSRLEKHQTPELLLMNDFL